MMYLESDFGVESYSDKSLRANYHDGILNLRNAIAAHCSVSGQHELTQEAKQHIVNFCLEAGGSKLETTLRMSLLTYRWVHIVVYIMPSGKFELVAC